MTTRIFAENNMQQKNKNEPFRENFKNTEEEDLKKKSVLDSLEDISAEGAKEIYEIMTTSEPFKEYSQMLDKLFKLVPQDKSNVTDFGPPIPSTNKKMEFKPIYTFKAPDNLQK